MSNSDLHEANKKPCEFPQGFFMERSVV